MKLDIEKLIAKHFKKIDWSMSSTEIYKTILMAEDADIEVINNMEAIKAAIEARQAKSAAKVKADGGREYDFEFKGQDISGLTENEYDYNYGRNFLSATADNGATTSIYWIKKDRTVKLIECKKEDILRQMSSSEVMKDVIWPEFQRQKAAALDLLNSLCPFEMPVTMTKWPWGRRDQLLNMLQECMSSWFLEHFTAGASLKYKAIENRADNEVLSYTITEFTSIFPQMTRDMFVLQLYNNLSFLTGKFATRSSELPLPYTNEEHDYAFVKLDMEKYIREGECPLWDLALRERLNGDIECEVFRAAVWQVYNPHNRSRQVIYMYDPHGRSGKSAMMRAAFDPIKTAQFAIQKFSLNNQFGFAKVWNKQLVTIGDNKNTKLLKSQIIHTMTGGDAADVEYKGQNSFMAEFRGHVWASGNVMPDIDTDAEHEVSRLVLFMIKKPESAKGLLYQYDEDGNMKLTKDGKPLLGGGDPSWEEKLKAELPCFLFKCKQDYAKYCPNDAELILPAEMQDRIQEECAELNKLVFDDFLEASVVIGSGEITDKEFRKLWTDWKEENMERYEIPKTELTFANLEEHLSKVNIKIKHKKYPDGHRERVWEGISSIDYSEKDARYLEAMRNTARNQELINDFD